MQKDSRGCTKAMGRMCSECAMNMNMPEVQVFKSFHPCLLCLLEHVLSLLDRLNALLLQTPENSTF
eukprot:COSAG02_NODE_20535_length_826_cov_11.618982_1_plen_65_part_10